MFDVPNTVDTERFRPAAPGEPQRRRTEFGWPVDRPLGIFVGRLSREKGVVDLLHAWERIPPPATLLVVGPDMPGHPWDEGARARELAASPALAGRVIFTGATSDPAPFHRAADFAIVPSHWESFGLSAAEAMSSGLAVAASAVGGLTDYIVDGTNGLLVPPQNPEALAAAIQRLIVERPALRPPRGRRPRNGHAIRRTRRPRSIRSAARSPGRRGLVSTSQPPPPNLHPPPSALSRNFIYATASSGSAVLLLAVLILAARYLGEEASSASSRFAVALATIGESLMDCGTAPGRDPIRRARTACARQKRAVFRNSISAEVRAVGAMVIAVLTLIGVLGEGRA